MPSPEAPGRRWLLRAAAALSLLATLSPLPAWALDLNDVMALLAQRKGGEARFTEERFVSGFDNPLRSSGTLTFAAPDRFARYTLEPRAESMEVQGNNLVLKRGGRTRQMALDAVPEVAALVDAVRGTLNGDASTLRKHFRTTVSGTAARWTLLLKPDDSRLATQVQQLEITGQGDDLRLIEMRLLGGDRSLMQIDPLSASPSASASTPARETPAR